MDKNILNFLNLAKSTDITRPNILHPYASEKHIIALDGHRMHYIANITNHRGYLSPLPIDEQFPAYERLIRDNPNSFVLHGEKKETFEKWKLALKEIRTFDLAYFEMRDGALFLCAKNHEFKTIQKTLSMRIDDATVYERNPSFKQSLTVRGEYLSDALSPIVHKRKSHNDYFRFHADYATDFPPQFTIHTPEGTYRSVIMPIAEPSEIKLNSIKAA